VLLLNCRLLAAVEIKRDYVTLSNVLGLLVFSEYLVISNPIKNKSIGYSRKEKIYHKKENLLVLLLNCDHQLL
jgi:hypothetical protein